MRNPYRSPAIEQGKSPFRNVNMLAWTVNLPEFFTRKRQICLVKARYLKKIWAVVQRRKYRARLS